MTELTSVVRIMNGFLRVLIDAELQPAERQEVAASLRSGNLVNCLLGVLEFDNAQRNESQVLVAVSSDQSPDVRSEKGSAKKTPKARTAVLTSDEMFNLVRKKKISKASLWEVIERLNSGTVLGTDADASMREIIEAFREVSSEAEWITLARAVNGEIENDSYLLRILGR